MDKIINGMFLNPVWEQFRKSLRTTGIGMEKTKHMSQELVWSLHRKTGQKLKSPHSWSFAFHWITTACVYMQAIIQGEVSLCSLDARSSSSLQNWHHSGLTSQRSGSSCSPGSRIRSWHRQLYPSHRHSGFGIPLCVPSQLAQSSSCPNNQIYFTSKTQRLHCNGQCLASVNLSICFWDAVHCPVPNQSWTHSIGRGGFPAPLPNPKDLHSAWILC